MQRIGILTGGGDVPGLNSILRAAQQKALSQKISLIGFKYGWAGVLKNDMVDLGRYAIDPAIGGTILKSSRMNINKIPNGAEISLENLNNNRIDGLIVIGGEDTLSNSFSLRHYPQILIAKTIDNDVGIIPAPTEDSIFSHMLNYFTVGYPTAAEKISKFVSLNYGLRTTAYSHDRIIIVESMGMHAGWLALASALGEPDFIIIPEFPVDYEDLLDKVIRKYEEERHLIIVIAEGARWKNGTFVHAVPDEIEEFDHPRFGGAAEALKNKIKFDLSKYFYSRNINAVNPSYLYRSGEPNSLDREWASGLGEYAVQTLAEDHGKSFFLSVQKVPDGFHIQKNPLDSFHTIKDMHRFIDDRFFDHKNYRITSFGKDYLTSILPIIPSYKTYSNLLKY